MTRFWLDWWCGDAPLKDRLPLLFSICELPEGSVAQALTDGEVSIRLRRSLDLEGVRQWNLLCTEMAQVQLSEEKDKVLWHLEESGRYSAKSLYAKLSQGATVVHWRDLWQAAVPLKIKIFAWQLALDKLPSALQLATRHGPSNGLCALCGSPEDASHIFFSCALAVFAWSVLRQLLGCSWHPANFAQFHHILSSLAGPPRRLLWLLFLAQSWALWQVRNKLAIEKMVLNHPSDVIFKSMVFLQLWSINSRTSDKEGIC
jgi:hypothetical protein